MNISTKLFNELLSKDSDNEENNDVCLISGEKLLPDHICLPCNHSFNYISLYNEVKKQKLSFLPKTSFSYLETQRLRKNQIKCPYCRKVVNGILPRHNNFPMLIYVNFPKKLVYNGFYKNQCSYVFKTGKRKNTSCNLKCYNEFCQLHHKRGTNNKKKILNLPTMVKLDKTLKGCCHHIMTKGKRKGEMCGKNALWAVNDKRYCTVHSKKYGKPIVTI
tara:strand:+ start:2679 stop:3332 length:654 start_codon:yes stop_codon:yes gene_type:complete